jgi:hypothetical protein|nr:MAG TPA: OUT domain-containing protein [Caudoviricetes sp.]
MGKKAKSNELRGGAYFQISDKIDENAATYRDRIAPSLITAEEYFATVEPQEEWQKRCEERALSGYYGVPVEVTIVK